MQTGNMENPQTDVVCGFFCETDYDDHNPPHFHAEYNGNKAIIRIDEARVIKGALPSRRLILKTEMLFFFHRVQYNTTYALK